MTITVQDQNRFWSRVNKQDGCWLWTAGVGSHGYGSMVLNGKHKTAHRISYEIAFGPIPSGGGYHGMCVCHRCDVKTCVNPSHLFLGSNAENMADRVRKGLQPRGAKHTSAKLTDAQIATIRNSRDTQTAIAIRFGICQAQVSQIRSGRRWNHLQTESTGI